MKRSLCAAVCALFVLADTAAAQYGYVVRDARRTISVTGEAELRVPPDEVVLSLGVETYDASLEKAKADNDTRVEAVGRAARAHGVPQERVRTEYFVAEPRYADNSRNEYIVLGFTVRKSVSITLRDLSVFEALLADALGAGATHIQGI